MAESPGAVSASRGGGGRRSSEEREAYGPGPGPRRPWRARRPWVPLRSRPGGRARGPRGRRDEAGAGGDCGPEAAFRHDAAPAPGPPPRRGRGRRARVFPAPRARRAGPAPPRPFGLARARSPPPAACFPPPRARLLPPPARARCQGRRRRGVCRADFARYVRGEPPPPGGLGGEIDSPSFCFDLPRDHSLRITVLNDHFYVGMPERQRLNAPMDNLKDVHRIALKEEPVESECSPGLNQHISPEEGPVTQEILHRSDYNPQISSDVKLLYGVRQNRDKRKGSYSTELEESSQESKRPCYGDTEMGDDVFAAWIRSCLQHRQSHSPRFRDAEYQELDHVKIKQEDTEHPVRVDGVPPAPEPGDSSHQPKELSTMPKKSILKKQIKLESTSSSQDSSLYSGHPSLPLIDIIADAAAKPDGQTVLDSPFREKIESSLCHKEKADQNAQVPEEHTNFLLPHELAIQDGSGFSRILSILTDSTSTQGRKWFSFFDIEDEEKFLYGDEEKILESECPPKSPVGSESEVTRQKASCCIPSSAPAIKQKSTETSPKRAKIHELVRTVGLDTVMSEISKLASSSQDVLSTVKSTENLSVQSHQMKVPGLNQNTSCCNHCQNTKQ